MTLVRIHAAEPGRYEGVCAEFCGLGHAAMPFAVLAHPPEVYAARLAHLTARESNKLTPTQAQAAVAAALLRQLHAVVTTGKRWDPEIATHGTRRPADLAVAA